jgi:hypothetical protein
MNANSLMDLWRIALRKKKDKACGQRFLQQRPQAPQAGLRFAPIVDGMCDASVGQCANVKRETPPTTGQMQQGTHIKALVKGVNPNPNDYYGHCSQFTYFDGGEDHTSVTVDMDAYKQIYKNFETIVLNGQIEEVGGTLKLLGDVLVIANNVSGSQSSISIPIADYEFHSHPNSCGDESDSERQSCMLGCPSTADCNNVLTRYMLHNNVAHLVFAFEGVYCVFGRKSAVERLGNNVQKAKNELSKALEKGRLSVKKFVKKGAKTPYMDMISDWLKAFDDENCPLEIRFTPIGLAPCIPPKVSRR